MIVYVAIWNDRHASTEPKVFLDKEKSIEWAKTTVRENCHDEDDLDEELNSAMILSKWIYFGCYSCEGDHIFVKECEVK